MGFLKNLFKGSELEILAPVSGEAVSIKEVNDPTFSEEILGKGIAIRPSEGKIVAPCDGIIGMMFDTGHAVCMWDWKPWASKENSSRFTPKTATMSRPDSCSSSLTLRVSKMQAMT